MTDAEEQKIFEAERNLLAMYRQLHDRLSDMIEGGDLSEFDNPDDYLWLVNQLARCAALDDKIEQLSK